MTDVIAKTRWCAKCTSEGKAAKLAYYGTMSLSPSFRLVVFECEHRHKDSVKLPEDEAQVLLTQLRGD